MADPVPSVAIATGSEVVTGTGTQFVAAQGDLFVAGGVVVPIASVQSYTSLTLAQPWPSASLSGAPYNILALGEYWRSAISINKRFADLLSKWEVVSPFKFDAAGTLAERDNYNNQPRNFVYVATDQLPVRVYIKLANTNASSDWSLPIYIGSGGQVEFQEALDQERQQRTQADAALGQRIDTLAAGSDPNVRPDLNNEVTRSTNKDNQHDSQIASLRTDLTAEGVTRGAKDTALDSRIDAEASARIGADNALGGRVDTEINARLVAEAGLGQRITDEASVRATKDTALDAADTALGGRITAEASTARAAEAALGVRVDSEAASRASADAVHDVRLGAIENSAAIKYISIVASGDGLKFVDQNDNVILNVDLKKLIASAFRAELLPGQQSGAAFTDAAGSAVLVAELGRFLTGAFHAILDRGGADGLAVGDRGGAALLQLTGRALISPAFRVERVPGQRGAFAVSDEAGAVLLQVDAERIDHPQVRALLDRVGRDYGDLSALAELIHVVIYGQSLSLGWNGFPSLSSAPSSFAEMFSGGVRPTDGGVAPAVIYAGTMPLREGQKDNLGETSAYGLQQMIAQLLRDEDGIDLTAPTQKLLVSCPGEGGQPIVNLISGTAPFGRLQANLSAGRTVAAASGRSYQPGAICWAQGETDYLNGTPRVTYRDGMLILADQAEAWARAVNGNRRRLPFVLYQTPTHLFYNRATPDIALAQLDLAKMFPDRFVMATPIHMLQFADDHLHLQNVGYRSLGAYFGLALKRWLWDGIRVKPLIPDRVETFGNYAVARFPDAVKGLVFDTTTSPDPGNKGFTLGAPDGSPLTVSGVSLVGSDKVVIKSNSAIPRGSFLRAGWIGDGYRGICNLRDRQGDDLIFDPGNINQPMHRWAPIFEEIIR